MNYTNDHQIEIDAQIEQSLRRYEELRAQGGETPLRKKLREPTDLSVGDTIKTQYESRHRSKEQGA